MNKGKKLLSELKLHSDYLRWSDSLNRYETWEEAIDEIVAQHRQKYKDYDIEKELEFFSKYAYDKKVLASQRNLQWRGKDVLKHNARLYNCSTTYVDRTEVFSQILFLLLCGCGVGYSVERRFVGKLPSVKERSQSTISYVIEDSIEGWGDALNVLMNSYFNGTAAVRFDYTQIREKNSLVAGKFLAPGYEPLKKSLEKVELILEASVGSKLTTLECHDIICHSADAVISAGLRRSALIAMFDKDDQDMMNCKTGNWFADNPQRARANNSAKLIKGQYTKDEYKSFFDKIRQFGEPGFLFVDDERFTTNPCMPSWATVLTKDGISTIGQIQIGDEIWSETGWTKVINKWSSGIKDVYRYRTNSGVFYGTENHRIVSLGEKVEVGYADSIDSLGGEFSSQSPHIESAIMDGLLIGDGSKHKASNNLIVLHIGKNDADYFNSEISQLIKKKRPGISPTTYEVETDLSHKYIKKTYNREIPEKYLHGSPIELASFLRGLYSANGSVVSNRITLKTSSTKIRDSVQLMLSSLGIRSYFTTNKSKKVVFSNGEYTCKQSYDVNISIDRERFVECIGFIQKYKNEKINLNAPKSSKPPKFNYPITEREFISNEEVFDITVDNSTHTFWSGGLNVSNCGEISFIPVNPNTGKSCIAFCNLSEINAQGIKTEQEFLNRVKAATIIGTLQSGYTYFPYLGFDTEDLVRWEALLGVSLTGWFDNPFLFDEELLQKGAQYAIEVNRELANKLDLSPSARITCVKPSGNASVILGCSSGIHPAHSRNYFRVMQLNKDNEVAQWLAENRPEMIEESVWSANNTDYVVYVPVTEPKEALVKNDVSGADFLDKVKLVQQNWVIPAKNDRGYSEFVSHNVSNTVNVDDWEEVSEYLWDNREYFCGVSFLPNTGDKIYRQAPFTSVLMEDELLERYGKGCMFASGIIVDLLHAFDNDLWSACDAIADSKFFLTGTHMQVLMKKDLIRRAKKFAKNYFKGELNVMIDCLKDVHLFHKWCTITRRSLNLDVSNILGKPKYLSLSDMASVACYGGQCEI